MLTGSPSDMDNKGSAVQDYNRGFGIIRHNIPKVAANDSFGIPRNLTSDNKAIVFTKLLFVAGK